jgi:hypothetical protein
MTWGELEARIPMLDEAGKDVVLCVEELLRPLGISLSDPLPRDAEANWPALLLVMMWPEIRRLRRRGEPDKGGETHWDFVAKTQCGAQPQLIFKSDSGEIVHVPADFVAALLENQVLSADMAPSSLRTSVLLQRAGVVEAEIPLTLLDRLLALRRRMHAAEGTAAALSGQQTETRAVRVNDASRPASRAAEQKESACS